MEEDFRTVKFDTYCEDSVTSLRMIFRTVSSFHRLVRETRGARAGPA